MPGSGWRGGGWSGERPGESWAVLSASMAASAKVIAVASSFGCTLLPVSAEARVPDTQNLVEMWVCASRHCIYLVACTVDLLSTLTNAYRVPSITTILHTTETRVSSHESGYVNNLQNPHYDVTMSRCGVFSVYSARRRRTLGLTLAVRSVRPQSSRGGAM